VSFDVDKARWVIWGAKDGLNTFHHIHEAYLRTLKHMGKEVYYFDQSDDISNFDFSGVVFLSMNCVVAGMPRRDDCFYVVHNAFNDPCMNYLKGLKVLPYGVHILTNRYADTVKEIGPDIFFDETTGSMSFYWATDLLPHEIEANKPTRVFNHDSKVVNYVGSVDNMKRGHIDGFVKALRENKIEYRGWGGYNNGRVVSIPEHVQLIKDSYMAPAFQGQDQVDQGYMSCRIFKNLSYGQMTLTHSKYANDVFGGRLIYNSDTYTLFQEGREKLQSMPLEELHSLMDLVARKHTFVNKLDAVIKAIRIMENR